MDRGKSDRFLFSQRQQPNVAPVLFCFERLLRQQALRPFAVNLAARCCIEGHGVAPSVNSLGSDPSCLLKHLFFAMGLGEMYLLRKA